MAKTFSKLTRPAMRALPQGQRITEHGIAFERLANGDGHFTVNIMVDRLRIHRSIGRESEGVTRTTAEDFISKARTDAREGRLNLPRRRKVPLTISAAVPDYLGRLAEEGGRDIDGKRKRLERWVVPFLGSKILSQITTFEIDRYKNHRLSNPGQSRRKLAPGEKQPPPRPATVNRELAALSHVLSKAVEWGWAERPPARIRKLKEENQRIVYLSPQQSEALLEAATHDQNSQIYPFILIGQKRECGSPKFSRSGARTSISRPGPYTSRMPKLAHVHSPFLGTWRHSWLDT